MNYWRGGIIRQISFWGGDSAGGGLMLALLAELTQRGTPPRAAFAMSPWTDLTLQGASLQSKQEVVLPAARMQEVVHRYLRDAAPDDPRASPLFARFNAPPPVLIQVGDGEALLNDAQPIETGEVVVARANAHVRYPCRFMLVAAANPCKCGYLADPTRACARVPLCGEDYMGRISGPLMDRFDLRVEVPPVAFTDLDLPDGGESSATVAARVAAARARQTERFAGHNNARVNADAEGHLLNAIATPDTEGRDLLVRVAERFGLSARGYHRVLRVARTIADLDGSDDVRKPHVAEAVSYRLSMAKDA